MAKEERDEKGRFVKGVTPTGAIPFSEGTAKEMQKKSAEARKDNRIIATALRNALLEQDPETGDPTIVTIVKKVTDRVKTSGGANDLRTMADTLGELEQKVQVDGEFDWHFKFGRDK